MTEKCVAKGGVAEHKNTCTTRDCVTSIRLSSSEYKKLSEIAEYYGVSRSDVLRTLLHKLMR